VNSNSPKLLLARPVEIICRRVAAAVLPSKLAMIKAVLIATVIVAGLHLVSPLSPETQNGLFLTQVIWAFGLGIAYACILAEFRTLIPLIVLVYIIKAFFEVSVGGLGASPLTGIFWGARFFGLPPAGMVIL